jgi:hypothetical protein
MTSGSRGWSLFRKSLRYVSSLSNEGYESSTNPLGSQHASDCYQWLEGVEEGRISDGLDRRVKRYEAYVALLHHCSLQLSVDVYSTASLSDSRTWGTSKPTSKTSSSTKTSP